MSTLKIVAATNPYNASGYQLIIRDDEDIKPGEISICDFHKDSWEDRGLLAYYAYQKASLINSLWLKAVADLLFMQGARARRDKPRQIWPRLREYLNMTDQPERREPNV